MLHNLGGREGNVDDLTGAMKPSALKSMSAIRTLRARMRLKTRGPIAEAGSPVRTLLTRLALFLRTIGLDERRGLIPFGNLVLNTDHALLQATKLVLQVQDDLDQLIFL